MGEEEIDHHHRLRRRILRDLFFLVPLTTEVQLRCRSSVVRLAGGFQRVGGVQVGNGRIARHLAVAENGSFCIEYTFGVDESCI